MTMASAALLLAASQVDRLTWAASALGLSDKEAVRVIGCWRMNREVRQMAERLKPQIGKVA